MIYSYCYNNKNIKIFVLILIKVLTVHLFRSHFSHSQFYPFFCGRIVRASKNWIDDTEFQQTRNNQVVSRTSNWVLLEYLRVSALNIHKSSYHLPEQPYLSTTRDLFACCVISQLAPEDRSVVYHDSHL